jgi:hypothetical protein
MSIQCEISSPATGELLYCPLVVTKFGSPTFSYTANVNYGDDYNQSIVFNHNNFSGLAFEHQYSTAGNYSVLFSISTLNVNVTLNSFTITGIYHFFKSRKLF